MMQTRLCVPARVLQTIFTPVHALVSKAVVRFEKQGVFLTVSSGTNQFLDVKLTSPVFQSYQTDGVVVGVKVEPIFQFTRIIEADTTVTMAIDSDAFKLHLRADGVEYTQPLIAPNMIRSPTTLPDVGQGSEVTVPGADLKRPIRLANFISTGITLGINETTLYTHAKGDSDEMKYTSDLEEAIEWTNVDVETTVTVFMLQIMFEALPTNDDLRLQFGNNTPVQLHCSIEDGDGTITYLQSNRDTESS